MTTENLMKLTKAALVERLVHAKQGEDELTEIIYKLTEKVCQLEKLIDELRLSQDFEKKQEKDHQQELTQLLGVQIQDSLWDDLKINFKGQAFRVYFEKDFYLINPENCREFLQRIKARAQQRGLTTQQNFDHLAVFIR